MYVLTNRQMRESDCYTIEKLSVPSLELMERAGKALAEAAMEMSPKGKIICVCGGGNNGGDGFVCARILKEQHREVELILYAEKFSLLTASQADNHWSANKQEINRQHNKNPHLSICAQHPWHFRSMSETFDNVDHTPNQ